MTGLARIHLNEASIGRSPGSGQVTAGIWLSVNGLSFPEAGWDDFAVLVLTWWSAALTRLLRHESVRERVDFMDGPYFVEVAPDIDAWQLDLGEDRRTGPVTLSTHRVGMDELVESVIAASEAILAACEEHNWETPQTRGLTAAVAELRGTYPWAPSAS